MRWRPLALGENFVYDESNPGGGRAGYAITLRLRGHRHCNCFRSIPVVYVAEHHPSSGPWPMYFTATAISAEQFLLNNPALEVWKGEQFLARHADVDVNDDVRVSYGFICSVVFFQRE